MTASHQITPSQARFQQEHRERRARIAALARPDTPILCLSASARSLATSVPRAVLPEPIPHIVTDQVEEWVERQINLHKKPVWFSIIDEIDPPASVRPTIGIIQRICCRYYEVTMTALLSPCRLAKIVRARQVAMFLAKELMTKSLPEIGRKFGDKDHTTVLHAVRKITRLQSEDEELLYDLATLRQRIREAI
jgi:chromosomal replication initiator protein